MTARAASKSASEIGKTKMLWLIALTFPVALASCNVTSSELAMDDSKASEVANEAVIVLAESEIRALKEKAQDGDLKAAQRLANFFAVNSGINNLDSIRWQLQAARLGDCEHWADLMFLENEEDFSIPSELFLTGESLVSIGEANKCPKYRSQKNKPILR